MNEKIRENLRFWITEAFLLLLAILVLAYCYLPDKTQIKRTERCEAVGGVLIKSAVDWTCVELKRIKE